MFLIYPITWISILLAYGLFARKTKRKRKALVLSAVFLFFFSNAFIMDEAMRAWEEPAIHRDSIDQPYDYAVVLSGMITYDSKLDRIDFQGGIDRLLQAVDLYNHGMVGKIYISGGSGSILEDFDEADLLKKYLVNTGISEKDIACESLSRNTYENAVNAAAYFGEAGDKRLLLITSAYHMKRAKACFEKQGLTIDVYPANRFSGPRKFVFDHLFIPDAGTLARWNALFHEIFGYTVYWIMGYL